MGWSRRDSLTCHCPALKLMACTLDPVSTPASTFWMLPLTFLCPDYVPDGQTCNLPLMPGEYGSNDPYTITLPDIPDAIANLLGKGKFEVRATVNKEDGSEMTCIWVILELTN